jgi:hypothetical protein
MCPGQAADCVFSVIQSSTGGARQTSLSGLTQGSYYQFKVLAHNVIGYSVASPILMVVAADVPNQPDPPSVWIEETSPSTVAVRWTAPIENVGTPTTQYIVRWKTQAEGDYLNSAVVDASIL